MFFFADSEEIILGFTSEEKAKTFLKTMKKNGHFENTNMLYPCTLGEYFDMQEKKGTPRLCLDMNAEDLCSHPLVIRSSSKYIIKSITYDRPDGKNDYCIKLSPCNPS